MPHWWSKTPGPDDEPFPEGFEGWPILDKINFNMERMTKRISINHRQQKRLRRLIYGVIVGFVLLVGLVGFTIKQNHDINKTQDQLADTQEQLGDVVKASCENGNNSRANLNNFFTYIITVSRQNPGNQNNSVITKFFDDFQTTIDKAFNQRPCDNLTDLQRHYTAPDFPDIPTQEEIKQGAKHE